MRLGPTGVGIRAAVRNSGYLLGSQLASLLLRIPYVLILVWWLAPAEYGILTYSMSWYLVFIPLTYLGADVVLSREIARDKDVAPTLIGTTLKMRCVAVLAVSITSAIVCLAIESEPQARILILILTAALAGRSFWMWGLAVLTALENARWIARLEIGFRSLEILAVLAYFLFVGMSLEAIAIVHATIWCLQAATTFAVIRELHPIAFRHSRLTSGKVLRDGVPGAIFAIAMTAFFQLPVVLYRQVEGTGDSLGYFALAFQLIAYLQLAPYMFALGSLPALSRSAAREDGKDRSAALSLTFMIPLAVAVLAILARWISEPVVEAIFGTRYVSAANVFAEALWLLIPMSLAMLLQQIVFARKIHAALGVAAPLLGVTTMAASFPALTHALDQSGSLIAVALGFSVWLACIAAELARAGFFTTRLEQR